MSSTMLGRCVGILRRNTPNSHALQRRYASGQRKGFKWPMLTLPLGVGFALISYQQLRHIMKRNDDISTASQWKIEFYKSLPLRIISRSVGKLAETELPSWLAPSIYKAYGRFFNVKMEEAEIEDYAHYKTFSEFFRRHLKSDVRPIDSSVTMVSPSDGRVLHLGEIDTTQPMVEQVKGVTYSLEHFLGDAPPDNQVAGNTYPENLKHNKDNKLYHCIIYLAPGDYHLYHSPVEWKVNYRRHFHGELLSVNPYFARKVPSLFALNERAVYVGEWQHGFFSMTPVGATNVGSIRVFHDPALSTNVAQPSVEGATQQYFSFSTTATTSLSRDSSVFDRGDMFGEFSLGSTIVLVFEAPASFKFNVTPGDTVKFGQPLGDIE